MVASRRLEVAAVELPKRTRSLVPVPIPLTVEVATAKEEAWTQTAEIAALKIELAGLRRQLEEAKAVGRERAFRAKVGLLVEENLMAMGLLCPRLENT